jgi:hypothetical protein
LVPPLTNGIRPHWRQRRQGTNKSVLEAEKARDEIHNQIQQIEEQLQPVIEREHALMMMLVMLMKFSQKLIIGT